MKQKENGVVVFSGGSVLRSRLDTIARTLDEEIDPAIRNATEEIAAEAKMRVPVDSGALKNAIRVVKVDDATYAVVAGDGDVYYGHIVENGGSNTPARPFLIPALESKRDNVDELIRIALRDL